jgi:uncharacterized UBP type Zn finger protein
MPTISDTSITNENIQNLIEMGFDREQAIEALRYSNNNVERAIEWVLKQEDSSPPSLTNEPPNEDQVILLYHVSLTLDRLTFTTKQIQVLFFRARMTQI